MKKLMSMILMVSGLNTSFAKTDASGLRTMVMTCQTAMGQEKVLLSPVSFSAAEGRTEHLRSTLMISSTQDVRYAFGKPVYAQRDPINHTLWIRETYTGLSTNPATGMPETTVNENRHFSKTGIRKIVWQDFNSGLPEAFAEADGTYYQVYCAIQEFKD